MTVVTAASVGPALPPEDVLNTMVRTRLRILGQQNARVTSLSADRFQIEFDTVVDAAVLDQLSTAAGIQLRPVTAITLTDPQCPTRQITLIPTEPAIACDDVGTGYHLAAAVLEGPDIARIERTTASYDSKATVIMIDFTPTATATLTSVTTQLAAKAAPENQLAMVSDHQVVMAPQVSGTIRGGKIQISGVSADLDSRWVQLQAAAAMTSFTLSETHTVQGR